MNKTQREEIANLNKHADDPLLNLSAVAQALGRDPATIGRWVVDGVLPSVLMPNKLRKVRKSVLEKWLGATDLPDAKEVKNRVSELEEEPELIPDLGLEENEADHGS